MGYLNRNRQPPTSKLSHADVIEIKVQQEKTIKKLAEKHQVSRATIRNILMEKTWRHVRIRKIS